MAIPSYIILYALNEQYIEIDGLTDALAGTPLNAATVTATLVNTAGTVADPAISGLALSYIAASNGNYRGTVAATFNPPAGNYTLKIDAAQGLVVLHLEIPVSVQTRRN